MMGRMWIVALALVGCETLPVDTDTGPMDLDADGVFTPDDCNDADATAYPGAPELCDGVDNNCDGNIDEDAPGNDRYFYVDTDEDGYGDPSQEVASCSPPPGTVGFDTDCDDRDDRIYPGAPEADCADPIDYNCDGSTGYADEDEDGAAACEDCDDNDPLAVPGGTEVAYDGIDNDCDTLTPDDDLDGDGVLAEEDCDEADPDASPDLTEVPYDGIDNDCDPNTVDDDLDGDGVLAADDCDDTDRNVSPLRDELPFDGLDNDCDPSTLDEDGDGDGYDLDDDCDDDNPLVSPGLAETPYNDLDDDCNPLTRDDDLDEDGFGIAQDCDDDNPAISPAATETPFDDLDNDCDDSTSDLDGDQDGFDLDNDCNDDDATVFPGQDETIYDGVDNDCDPATLDDDLDQDGVVRALDCDDADPTSYPGAGETFYNGVDNNCDGGDDYDRDGDGFRGQVPGGGAPTDCNDNDADIWACGDTPQTAGYSCETIHADFPSRGSGTYWVNGERAEAVQVRCDMQLRGGGWTVINQCEARNQYNATLFAYDAAATAGVDGNCRPYTRDQGDSHTYAYTFTFPSGFSEIIMKDWTIRANAGEGYTSDMSFQQSAWNQAAGAPGGYESGDVSFGSGTRSGPVSSFAATGQFFQVSCNNCVRTWPNPTTVYTVPETTLFRMGWGETGSQHEGWYPWWTGEVYLR